MIKPWHLMLVVIVGCVGGSVVWWAEERASWVPSSPKLPDIPVAVEIALPAPMALQAAKERPVFWTSRRVKAIVVKDNSQIEMLAQARLISMVQTGGLSVGWIRKKDGTLLKLTNDSTPWRIESFDGRVAKLVAGDGEHHDLSLETSRNR